MKTPPKVNFAQLLHREMRSPRTGERFSHTAVLSELLGLHSLFVHHEILPPGRRASSPHWHTEREEMVVVLTGQPTAHFGDHSERLRAGDVIAFPPGGPTPHSLENSTEEIVELLVIAPVAPQDIAVTD